MELLVFYQRKLELLLVQTYYVAICEIEYQNSVALTQVICIRFFILAPLSYSPDILLKVPEAPPTV
jgi:hypothetical protein